MSGTAKYVSKNYTQNVKSDEQDVEGLLKSFPAGYRFKPRDEELVLCYLKPKLLNLQLPPNRIVEVELYHYNPEVLIEKNKSYGEGEWYFFTPRDKKYPNGSRPKRAAGDGYWKATGADKTLKSSEGDEIGYRKALVFYKGKPPKGQKTNWMMHEFRLKDPPARSKLSEDNMRLDDWILCKIYKKTDKSMKTSALSSVNNALTVPQEDVPFDFGELEELASLNGASQSFYDDMMLEHNSSLFLDNISDYYDQSFVPMAIEQATVALPSSTDSLGSMDNHDEHEDKLSSDNFNL